jgi:hypothetical protein
MSATLEMHDLDLSDALQQVLAREAAAAPVFGWTSVLPVDARAIHAHIQTNTLSLLITDETQSCMFRLKLALRYHRPF